MDASREGMRCGLCGQLMDAQHSHQQHDEELATGQGKRVECVVVELRGAVAHYQVADGSSRTHKTGAAGLAEQLGIDLSELLGRRYTCWEEPAEYGVVQSEFKLA
ncbi:hypothetical protein [Streptomyces sp. NPDC037389]|uniref:hypothetical protein n=1 Tax=Streptomyces sp. NPDC037389 TaxID=3155369 RepID=UPI0034104B05